MKYTLEEAHQIQLKGDLELAERIYTSILNENPNHWLCQFFFATLYLQTNRNGLAIALLEAAARVKPQMPEIWNNLGTAYKRENYNERARACLLRAVSLKRETDALNNLSTIYINEGEPERAEKWAEQAIKESDSNAFAHWNYSLSLLEQGKFKEGFKEYAWGLKSKDRRNRDYHAPFWNGEKKKNVVIWGEQGVGDEIMFASCIPDLKRVSKRVIFDCHPRLKNLFERSFNIKCYPTRKEDDIPWVWDEKIDYKLPIGNVPQFFRKEAKDFPGKPYLKADPELVKEKRAKLEALGPGPYIGISWHGGKKKTRNDLRSIPLKQWGEILEQDVTYVSLQYTKEHEQEGRDHGLHILPEVYEHDYDQTAALVMALDLVISVNTSVVHLGGAMGQTVWCLTPTRRAWRYYEPEPGRMVWYDSVKLFSQVKDNWEPALDSLFRALMLFCESHSNSSNPGATGDSHPLKAVDHA